MTNVLIYGGALLAVVAALFGFQKLSAYVKGKNPFSAAGLRKEGLFTGGLFLMSGLGVSALIVGYALATGAAISSGELWLGSAGMTLFIFLTFAMVALFIVHYYKKNLDPMIKQWAFRGLLIGIVPLMAAFLLMMEGYDALLSFPLIDGIYVNGHRLIAFYALFILGGALLVYFITDHQLHMEGYRKNILENVFYVAFPAGVIGSRLWYVIGQWQTEFANRPFWEVFATWEGGLTIIGGALFGSIAGILFVLFRRKELNILHTMDVIMPAILIAQAIGRWGNFFNQEVYGAVTDPAQWWFLPSFIIQQMTINGEMRVPLFLIEGLINLSGYFIIRYGVGVGLKKYIVKGDLGALYPLWYGVTRFILEPLRDPAYIMNDWWSRYGALGFIIVGVLGIVAFHVYDYLMKKKAKGNGDHAAAH